MPQVHLFFLRQKIRCNLILKFDQSLSIGPAETAEHSAPEEIPVGTVKKTGHKVNNAGLALFIQQNIVHTPQVTVSHTTLMHAGETLLQL